MTLSKIAIIFGGLLSFLLFLFHTKIYQLFGWQDQFTKVGIINGKIIYTINLALALLFLFFSIISFAYYNELATCEGLAFGVCLGLTLFWLWRLVWQFVYFPVPLQNLSLTYCLLSGGFLLLTISYFIPVITKIFGK
jgi:hypothetical protein